MYVKSFLNKILILIINLHHLMSCEVVVFVCEWGRLFASKSVTESYHRSASGWIYLLRYVNVKKDMLNFLVPL